MIDLPTAAQIKAITDVPALRDIGDEIERTILQIEAQLEFDTGDDEWAKRAANALALFRYTDRLLKRRLHALTRQEPERRRISIRPDEDSHPLTHQAFAHPIKLDTARINSLAEVEAVGADLIDSINAVEADRADEIARVAVDRDEGFISRANGVLRALKAARSQLQDRRSQLARVAKEAAQADRNANRQQRFIDAAKAMLPSETYQALWAQALAEDAES